MIVVIYKCCKCRRKFTDKEVKNVGNVSICPVCNYTCNIDSSISVCSDNA